MLRWLSRRDSYCFRIDSMNGDEVVTVDEHEMRCCRQTVREAILSLVSSRISSLPSCVCLWRRSTRVRWWVFKLDSTEFNSCNISWADSLSSIAHSPLHVASRSVTRPSGRFWDALAAVHFLQVLVITRSSLVDMTACPGQFRKGYEHVASSSLGTHWSNMVLKQSWKGMLYKGGSGS